MLKKTWWKMVKAVAPQFEKDKIIPPALSKAIVFFLQCPKDTRYQPGLPADTPWTTLVMIVAEHYLAYQHKPLPTDVLHECAEYATFALVLSVCDRPPSRLDRMRFGKILGDSAAIELVPRNQPWNMDATSPSTAAKWLQKYLWLVKPDTSGSSSAPPGNLQAPLTASQEATSTASSRVKRERDDDNTDNRRRKQPRTEARRENETLEKKQQRLRSELESVEQLVKEKREKELMDRIQELENRLQGEGGAA